MTVTVQLKPQFVESRFLPLNDLSDDLQHDPDLGDIAASRLGKILQMIFISSGDFTFLFWFGKS